MIQNKSIENSVILITGGTGSFGGTLTELLLKSNIKEIRIFSRDENKKVIDISFEGEGCAISMASASIMTDLMKGKSETEVKEITSKFLEMIKEKDEVDTNLLKDEEKMKLMSLGGVKNYPMRVKCATLSWHALSSALEDFQKVVKTE